jgi:hypothetical protein
LIGRWWFVPLAGIAWSLIVLGDHATPPSVFVTAFAMGITNALLGVLAHKLFFALMRGVEWVRSVRWL